MKHIVKLPGFPAGVDMREVHYIQADGPYCHLHRADKKLTVCLSLSKLTERLSLPFVRTHKQYAVNLNHARLLSKQGNDAYVVVMKNGMTIPIGRTHLLDVSEHWQSQKQKTV